MIQQISRFSLHQNAKVFAVLMLVGSLFFTLPFALLVAYVAPAGEHPPLLFFLITPFAYLIFGYVAMIIACAIYNFLFRYIGGLEFEARTRDEA
jgi:hypothetical protein